MLYGGLLVLFLLHGVSALKILAILYANYRITRACGTRKVAPFIIWTFNLAILFANKIFEGYAFGSVLPFLSFLVRSVANIDIERTDMRDTAG